MAVTTRRINHDINVERLRLASDTDTDAVRRAFNVARAASTPKKRIILPVDYTLTGSLDVAGLNGAVIEAADPNRCQQYATTAIAPGLIHTTGAVQDLIIRGLGVQGRGVDDATGPRRGRTWSAGIGCSVFLRGDLAPLAKLTTAAASGATTLTVGGYVAPGNYLLNGAPVTVTAISGSVAPYTLTLGAPLVAPHATGEYVTVTYQVRNVRMEHSYLGNLLYGSNPAAAPEQLPVLFAGIRGDTEFFDVHAHNTMDCGFVFNEHVKVRRFTGTNSADNGISLSRGNKRVEVSQIDITNPAYFGLWLAGFFDDTGPESVVASDISIKNPGKAGIWADGAPRRGIISNFRVDQGYNRGPSDSATDAACVGVFFGGYPNTDRANPASKADGWRLTNGVIERAARAAVLMNGVSNVVIDGVSALDIGTQYLADGTTAISSSDLTQNVGFLLDNATVSTRVTIKNTDTNDTRSTPYCNHAIQPLSSSYLEVGPGNTMKGCRNAFNITETSPDPINLNRVLVALQNAKFTAGATAGSSAGTGTIAGFDTNGAAGSARYNNWLTAAVQRWRWGADGTAESGSNVGSDLVATSFDDSGSAIATILRLTRLGAVTIGRQGRAISLLGRLVSGAASVSVAAGAQATAASAAGNGANDTAGTLNATTVASPVAGALVSVTFVTAYSATPHVVITPTNQASRQCSPYLSARSATGFTISADVAPGASTSLQYDYIVVG